MAAPSERIATVAGLIVHRVRSNRERRGCSKGSSADTGWKGCGAIGAQVSAGCDEPEIMRWVEALCLALRDEKGEFVLE